MERKCSCGNFFDVRHENGICPKCKKDIFEPKTKPMSKTALQQFHEAILSGKITDTLANIDYYLELERQQIINAASRSCQSMCYNDEKSAEQYYNETFGK